MFVRFVFGLDKAILYFILKWMFIIRLGILLCEYKLSCLICIQRCCKSLEGKKKLFATIQPLKGTLEIEFMFE